MRSDTLNWWTSLSLNQQIEYCQNANYDIDNLQDNQIQHIYDNIELYSLSKRYDCSQMI